MRPEDVQALLRAEPFQPLRICMQDGTTYEVRHPHMTMATHHYLVVAFPDPESNGRWGDDYVILGWPQVADIGHFNTEGAAT